MSDEVQEGVGRGHRRRRRLTGALAVGLAVVSVAPSVQAASAEQTEVLRGDDGARVTLQRGDGCAGTTMSIDSGEVADPTPGLVSSLVVAVDERCNVRIVDQASRRPVGKGASSDPTNGVADPAESAEVDDGAGFEPNTVYGNYIRSSQTLQDIVNIDIAKLKFTHDRVWEDYYGGFVRFKAAGESAPNATWWLQGSTSVSWNHPHTPVKDWHDVSWIPPYAGSAGHGDFHSDFLWCNLQPGQNFTLGTVLTAGANGAYNASFGQSQVCSGTHMATSKYTSTTPPPF